MVSAFFGGVATVDNYQRILLLKAKDNVSAIASAINVNIAVIVTEITFNFVGIVSNLIIASAAFNCVFVANDKDCIVARSAGN